MNSPDSIPVAKPLPAERTANLPAMRPMLVRWLALAVFIASVTLLWLAIRLRPDPSGFGTHQQLGMAPCGILIRYGLPCPTCGMTTAFSHTVRGQWLKAIMVQPGGFVLCVGAMIAAVVSMMTLWLGAVPQAISRRLTFYHLFWIILITVLGGWGIRLLVGLVTGELPRSHP